MHLTPPTFIRNSEAALADAHLRGAIGAATDRFAGNRNRAVAERPDWEALRTQARAIKDDVLAHLDRYLEQLEAKVTERGGKVHWARDAAEAREIIVGISKRSVTEGAVPAAAMAAKSKSMTGEEVHLNEALAAGGIDPVETDLGEYIIQIAGETPSHIVMPAIHKTRGDIAKLFRDKLNVPTPEKAEEITALARKILREKFVQAGIGISGVNFAVAATGTIMILENEGNGRLSTTLPRTHIALMGIEKILPRVEDLAPFLRLLPRSGTGQRLTSYQSFITGPRRADEEDGPEAFHLVILDNRRTEILADPEARESLACIRCGACLNVCPIYQQIGGHAYGWVYPGPIGAILTPQYVGLPNAADLPYASSLCGACKDACPVKIDIPHVLLHLRKSVKEGQAAHGDRPARAAGKPSWAERAVFRIWARVLRSPRLFRLGGWIAARLAAPLAEDGRIRNLPAPFSAWTDTRDFPAPAKESFRDRWYRGID